jgi:hypothetical protein
VGEFESATGTRAAIVTRFGTGQVASPGTIIQSGDTLHVLTAADIGELTEIASRAPVGSIQ